MNREQTIAAIEATGARVLKDDECMACATGRHYGPDPAIGGLSADKIELQAMANVLLGLALDPLGAGHRLGCLCDPHGTMFLRIVAYSCAANGYDTHATLDKIWALFEEPRS